MREPIERDSKNITGRVMQFALLPVGFVIASALSGLFLLVIATGAIRDVTWRR
jgi:hypothetical protein